MTETMTADAKESKGKGKKAEVTANANDVIEAKTLQVYNPVSALKSGKYMFTFASFDESRVASWDNTIQLSFAVGSVYDTEEKKDVEISLLCQRAKKDVPAKLKKNSQYPVFIKPNARGFNQGRIIA
jgi:hypothetical protein